MCRAKAPAVLVDDGALAGAMTEEWYATDGKPTGRAIEFLDERAAGREFRSEEFGNSETVPPCRTCEIIVPMALCAQGKKSCTHEN